MTQQLRIVFIYVISKSDTVRKVFMNNKIHFKHWILTDYQLLERARSFHDLFQLAANIMTRFEGDLHMVSGPISTGGVGTIDGNRRVFEKAIEMLATEQKLNVFSQMPFEDKMVELYKQWHSENPREDYCSPILTDFYEPLFSLGRVKVLHFIRGWQSSVGARWEHDNCVQWEIERRYL